jgi:rubredoxin
MGITTRVITTYECDICGMIVERVDVGGRHTTDDWVTVTTSKPGYSEDVLYCPSCAQGKAEWVEATRAASRGTAKEKGTE